jgi:uncharacterized membrane protein HdeD (DUF308 family)
MKEEGFAMPWWLLLLEGIVVLVLGVLLITNPAATTAVLVQVLGIYWLIAGIFRIISIFLDSEMWGWKLFIGVVGILAGVLILQHPIWSTALVPATLVIILGINGLIMGVVELFMAFKGGGWGAGILGVLSILFGIFLMFNPLAGAVALAIVLGIFGIIGGIASIIMAFRIK